jgi:hypothetical protein
MGFWRNEDDELTNQPIIEAYVGEYASGKSENAVNRAVALRRQGRQVTLVDLDTVEPCYTLRPIKKELEELGLTVECMARRFSIWWKAPPRIRS